MDRPFAAPLGWFGIAKLGLAQAALGAIVVLVTSTMNRVMVVEWGFPAIVPGLLVALHYGIQVLRPRFGHGSDAGSNRTPWIIGGMAALAVGAVAAALATALMGTAPLAGLALAVVAFAVVGMGVGASGTSLLVLLAARVAPARRPAAATIVWIMMIFGIAVTATVAGRLLDPFSAPRLVAVTAGVAVLGMAVTVFAVWRAEGPAMPVATAADSAAKTPFFEALRQVWAERRARQFAVFVFVSMLAYSAQELILEPFAGSVFALTPGESAGLTGLQHGGVLLGMLFVAIAGSVGAGVRFGSLRTLTIGGCVLSAVALLALAGAGLVGPAWPLRANVFVLGVGNGAFAVSAIGAMMGLAHDGRARREGVRMGLWGAAQAVAFGLGGLVGTSASDVARLLLGAPGLAYAAVFVAEAALFVGAAWLAGGVFSTSSPRPLPVDIAASARMSSGGMA